MAASKVTQQLPIQAWAHAVGELPIQGRIESRFSTSGKLLFVLAFVPKQDFEETYGSNAISAIVHKGRVLALENRDGLTYLVDRFHGQFLEIDFVTDRFGFSCLRIRDRGNTLFKKQIGFDTEQSYKFELKTIRWMADRFIQAVPLDVCYGNLSLQQNHRSTLHIVPEVIELDEDENESVEDYSHFLRTEVNCH
jgi:hypothetical protein